MSPATWTPVERGDLVHLDGHVWRVESIDQALDLTAEEASIANDRRTTWCWKMVVTDLETGQAGDVRLNAAQASHVHYKCRIRHVDEHYAQCSVCSEPWPCWHFQMNAQANRMIESMERRQAWETAHPHACAWCARLMPSDDKRFKTVRGLAGHARSCKANPTRWDLGQWVPILSEELKIVGGYQPSGLASMQSFVGLFSREFDADANIEVVNALMVCSLLGPEAVPATRSELVL